MKKGRLFLAILLILSLMISLPAGVFADASSDLILKLLVKKGIISQKEVNELKAEIKKTGEEQVVKVKKPEDFRVYWKEGLRFKSEDKKFSLKIGGRIMTDAAWMQEESPVKDMVGGLRDSAEFRRARFYASGTIYDDFIYKLNLEFAGGDADFKDVYIGLTHIPYLGTLKVGHFKERFSLEQLTSSKYITFMERSLPDVFSPGRNLGIGLNSTAFDKRVTWAAGIFRDANGYGDVSTNEYNVTARVTGLPWYEDKGEKLVHLGLAYSLRNPEMTLDYDERPEAHLAPNFVDTGAIPVDFVNLLGIEGAVIYGPLSLQGEFTQSFVDRTGTTPNLYFEGFYGEVSYFLTGEHRKYSKSAGVFSRVKPHNNFSIKDGTFGAWEIAARYSHLDLKDEDIDGGILNDVTVGLNWYLNPNTRIMWNYVHSNRNGVGNADIVETRFQIDF